MSRLDRVRRVVVATGVAGLSIALAATAQDTRHGRKYKSPPVTSHLEVLVLRESNGKVVENAGVIFHPSKDGVDEGNLEVKSGVDGKAFIDIIPQGSVVEVQVISSGYTTYSGELMLDGPSKQLTVRLQRPVKQVSSYEGSVSNAPIGVQESSHRVIVAPGPPKPISPSDPVIKLSNMPADPKQGGDPTAPASHTVTPPVSTKAPKQPNKTSAPTGPTVDGTAASSPPSN